MKAFLALKREKYISHNTGMHRFSKTATIKNVHKKHFGLIFNPNVNLSAKFTRCCSYLEMFFAFPIFIFS